VASSLNVDALRHTLVAWSHRSHVIWRSRIACLLWCRTYISPFFFNFYNKTTVYKSVITTLPFRRSPCIVCKRIKEVETLYWEYKM